MKKIILKSVSVFLVLILCFSAAMPAFAASENEINRTCPRIFVNGFMSSLIYADKNNPASDVIWPPSQNSIINAVSKAALPLADLAATGDYDSFAVNLSAVLDELFEPVILNYNGEPKANTGVIFNYPAPETIGTDAEVTFEYDWRVEPLVSAKELSDFIDYICDCSGSKQVVIECHSLGGVIALSYFELYGTEKVKSVVFSSTAIYGETYTGELLTGDITVSGDALRNYMDYAVGGIGLDNFFSVLFTALADFGVFDFVCGAANGLVEKIYDKALLSVLKLFANWPAVWAMVPDELIGKAQNFVFDEIYKKSDIDYSGLKSKIDNYNTLIGNKKADILKKVNDNANLYVISKHGYSSLPLTSSWDSMGDGTVDTKYNSFGATAAKYNQKLDVKASEYVSPDKTIDASTCLFPEQTWFIENLKHNDMPSDFSDFVDTLLHYDGQATVETFTQYPRFMEYDYEDGCLKADEANVSFSFFRKLLNAIKELFNIITAKLKALAA